MAQKTNLNINPYYDDFDADKQFYKVLFNPGRPVQARELTTLQSILQDQVETFGSHIFKEGAMVIPGGITFDPEFYAVKLNQTNLGANVTLYLEQLVGKKISGETSEVNAVVQYVQLPNDEVEYPTLYVKYLNADSNSEINPFTDAESLICDEEITYGNTTINVGVPFASLIDRESTAVGSAVSINDGVYFIRGYFVNVNTETIILDYYTSNPSYRIGLKINEEIITSKDDSSLYDNAKGFTNYASSGADRFKISTSLVKKELDDLNDTDFIELMRVGDGLIKKVQTKASQYSFIRDYLAQRTYDESGDYSVDPFFVSVHNSLNDRIGNDGLFFSDDITSDGNVPSDDLMCLKLSPGKAYVRGYDISKIDTTIIDVEKPRDTEKVSRVNVPFEMGNILRVNNVSGVAQNKQTVSLYSRFKNGTTSPNGFKVGEARVYNFKVTDSKYTGSSTRWDLFLYDIQTYTELTLNQAISTEELPASSFVKGKSSGASGYAVYAGGNNTILTLRQTSGTFIRGEQLIINGVESKPRSIVRTQVFDISDVRSVYQASDSGSGYPYAFLADADLDKVTPKGFTSLDKITISADDGFGNCTVTASGKSFLGISTESIIRYQRPGLNDETYSRVTGISADGKTLNIGSLTSVVGIFTGASPGAELQTTFSLGIAKIKNEGEGFLYTPLPDSNIASLDLSDSNLTVTKQITGETTDGDGILTFDDSALSGITSAFFDPFDVESYSIHYSDGTVASLSSDQFNLSSNTVTVNGLSASESDIVVNVTAIKNGVQSRTKNYTRSKTINVNYSKYQQSGTGISTSINDGLTYNQYYGLRVQDEEISLNYPDVVNILAVYESLNTSNPTLDTIQISSLANVDDNAIIGENIVGSNGAYARIISKPSANTLGIVYLNSDRFEQYEEVKFEESNIISEVELVSVGSYKNITSNYILNSGQKNQYYDYSRLVRKKNTPEPSNRIMVIFDHYTVPTEDDGDVFTVLSYKKERYQDDIPSIELTGERLTDILDFRPRVPVFDASSASASPFDFSSRTFGTSPKHLLAPNTSSLIGYDYYLGRVDRLYLNKYGEFILDKGVSSTDPKPSKRIDEVMEIASIILPPYLYNTANARISLIDNKRYTMRDIGKIENRVKNLERVTSLSLLEVDTKTLQVKDADGLDRFKTGFFVDDFKNNDFIDPQSSSIEVDRAQKVLRPILSRNAIKTQIAPKNNITEESLDLNTDFDLLDANVRKTGQFVTLNYKEVGWIEQPIATRIENVNPFHVVEYIGNITLYPSRDTWSRTIRLNEKVTRRTQINFAGVNNRTVTRDNITTQTRRVRARRSGVDVSQRVTSVDETFFFDTSDTSSVAISSKDVLLSSGAEKYMRSRNTEFRASNLRPFTRFYQYFDGNKSVDFIPKLIEISIDRDLKDPGSLGVFQVGETVIGSVGGKRLIKFRVAKSNHKSGGYNNPTDTFNLSPYNRTETIPSAYSGSSKILNIDTYSLSEEAQGKFYGYLKKGMQLTGQTSGAVSFVKDLRLVSDEVGDVIGSFFLRDPLTSPPPPVRIGTGTKTYKLTSSKSNATPVSGDKGISTAEITYRSEGTWETRQVETEEVTTVNRQLNVTRSITNNILRTITTRVRRRDPLAQSFTVGDAPGERNNIISTDDTQGVFLTAVDIFMRKKDKVTPLTVEIRTVELGTPTLTRIGNAKVLKPSQVNISEDGTAATHVVFDYPIYLPPGNQYAVVLLAPESINYEAWIAQMGEKSVNRSTLSAENARYTRQFAIGRLYKSQNGGEWTADDYQDLKFKLYKAEFTSNSGVLTFHNPSLNESNGYSQRLDENTIAGFSKKASIGIVTTSSEDLIGILTEGRKISESVKTFNYGYVVGTGSSVASAGVSTGGENYSGSSQSNVSTYAITGNGSGLKLDLTITSGAVTGVSVASRGNGYAIGDLVGIVTSSAGNTGTGAEITVTGSNGIDTLYLDNIQAQSFTVGSQLRYYNDSGSPVSLASTTITSYTEYTNQDKGNVLRLEHFNHGMYSTNNKVEITGIESSEEPTYLTAPILTGDAFVSVADTSRYSVFEGMGVGATNFGYMRVEDEIIGYESVGNGTLEALYRGLDGTVAVDHPSGSTVTKYELNGVSLRRINTTHDISDFGNDIYGYYVEFDRTDASGKCTDRSTDGSLSGIPQLSFNRTGGAGGEDAYATENIVYDTIIPTYTALTPGQTRVTAQIRTVTGTSIAGSEISFEDSGYETVELNTPNKLNSIRMVCSNINETTYLSNMPRNKSFTSELTLTTDNKNISPIIDLDDSTVELRTSLLNKPVSDYVNDRTVNSLDNDLHMAAYVGNLVTLSQPANSLKVIFAANRPESSDIRVLYSLVRPDSSEVEQTFELFPGYDNLTLDLNGDGYLDVIDPNKNSGRSDVLVPASLNGEFLEYEFTASNLGFFSGFRIKILMSGTDQSRPPIIKDLRTLALV